MTRSVILRREAPKDPLETAGLLRRFTPRNDIYFNEEETRFEKTSVHRLQEI